MDDPNASAARIGNKDRNAIGSDHTEHKPTTSGVGGIPFLRVVRLLIFRNGMNDVRMNLSKPNDRPTRNTDSSQKPTPVFSNTRPLGTERKVVRVGPTR